MATKISNLLKVCSKHFQGGAIRLCSNTSTNTSSQDLKFSQPNLEFNRSPNKPREALVQSLMHSEPTGLISLHPEIFAQFPNLKMITKNFEWQECIRDINYYHEKTRAELPGSGKKIWQQKGLGKARHKSYRSPIFKFGGKAHPSREFTTRYFHLGIRERLMGLTSMLSVKFAQDDLVVVDSLDIPSAEPEALEELVESRLWGPSVLFCQTEDAMPTNICSAIEPFGHYNLMPVYGMNVMSMVKHATLVVTVDAIRQIEEKVITCIYDPENLQRDVEFQKRPLY